MAIAEVYRHFPAATASAAAARRFTDETLRGWGLHGLVDEVRLMVNELIANAVLHAGSGAMVRLVLDEHWLRVDVEDASDRAPVLAEASDRGGRGLKIVDALSSDWGYALTPTGKRVWFEVRIDDAASPV